MSNKELLNKQKHNEKLKKALEILKTKKLYTDYKNDMKKLLDFVRPEYMTSDVFNNECEKVRLKYLELSNSDDFDQYEKEIIKNSASQVFEFQMKAYLTMCYY